ncbi:MAG: hypothetical protein V3T72_15455 [Thermoanaerobaculia bacterium]
MASRYGLLLAAILTASPGSAEPMAAELQGQNTPEPACEGCAVQDDGSLESGYGWVPSVDDGQYVQQIDSAQLPNRRLETVCVCWLRTRMDSDVDFEVVFYESVLDEKGEPKPALEPYASVPATATGVPLGIVGAFYEVDVRGIQLAEGISYVGVRWDAMADQFFFVCLDQTPETEPVEVFFIDEIAEDWTSVFDSNDPIFILHRALLVRVCSEPLAPVDIPVLSGFGLGILALLLAGIAVWMSRRRRQSNTAST